MTLLAAALDLPQNVIPATKPRSGRPPKTSKHLDDVWRQELRRNHYLDASELKEMHPDHLANVSIRSMSVIIAPLKEGPEDIKSTCGLQNSPDST